MQAFLGVQKDHQWPGMRSVAKVESRRELLVEGKVEEETRYYISSLPGDAKQIVRAASTVPAQARFGLLVRARYANTHALGYHPARALCQAALHLVDGVGAAQAIDGHLEHGGAVDVVGELMAALALLVVVDAWCGVVAVRREATRPVTLSDDMRSDGMATTIDE